MKLHLWTTGESGGSEHDFLTEVSCSASAAVKQWSERVGELLMCVLAFRRISETVHCLLNACNKLPSNFLHFCWLLSVLTSEAEIHSFSSSPVSPPVPSQWSGEKENYKDFPSRAIPNNFPMYIGFSNQNGLKPIWLQIQRWPCMILVTKISDII